jgi:beta-galactosidase
MSFYPKQVTGCRSPENRWPVFDAFHAASGHKGFYISEMQTHVQAMFNPSTSVRPYELKQWCYESVAAGAKGLIYWMWRPFTKGLQTAGRGLIDYRERSTPRLELAKEIGKTLADVGALTPVKSRIGILFDPLCLDFQVLYTKCYRVDQNIYLSSLCGAYKAFLAAGVRADFVTLDQISEYKAIVLSNHIVIGKETASLLGEYVRSGGKIICDGRTGLVDEAGLLGQILPGGEFNRFMGHEFIDSDYEDMKFTFNGKTYNGYYGREITALTDGEAISVFEDGTPAIVKKRTGKGEVVTVNTYLWYSYGTDESCATEIASLLSDEYALRSVTASAPLMVRASEGGDFRYAFVFNYTDSDVCGHIHGCGFDTDVTVKAHDVILVRIEK